MELNKSNIRNKRQICNRRHRNRAFARHQHDVLTFRGNHLLFMKCSPKSIATTGAICIFGARLTPSGTRIWKLQSWQEMGLTSEWRSQMLS